MREKREATQERSGKAAGLGEDREGTQEVEEEKRNPGKGCKVSEKHGVPRGG